MIRVFTLALAALAMLAGCTGAPTRGASEFDAQYEYGYFAGLPQRPDPFD